MADETPRGTEGSVRAPQPDTASQDPKNAAIQEQVRRDSEANRDQASRTQASVPAGTRDRTVGEIVDDANRRADADAARKASQ